MPALLKSTSIGPSICSIAASTELALPMLVSMKRLWGPSGCLMSRVMTSGPPSSASTSSSAAPTPEKAPVSTTRLLE